MKRMISLLLVLSCLLAVVPMAHAQQSSSMYKLGDTVEDFSVTLSDGQEVSLYGLLEEKEAVLINFWASWCGWCQFEFPYLNTICNQMSEQIGTICLTVDPGDTDETVLQLQQEWRADAMSMGRDTIGLVNRFNVEGLPTSVLIDRNGVICNIHVGAFWSRKEVYSLFSCVIGDDYETTLISSIPEIEANEYIVIIGGRSSETLADQDIILQLCDDSTCTLVNVKWNNDYCFYFPSDTLEVSVFQAPEGYLPPTETYTVDLEDNLCIINMDIVE